MSHPVCIYVLGDRSRRGAVPRVSEECASSAGMQFQAGNTAGICQGAEKRKRGEKTHICDLWRGWRVDKETCASQFDFGRSVLHEERGLGLFDRVADELLCCSERRPYFYSFNSGEGDRRT